MYAGCFISSLHLETLLWFWGFYFVPNRVIMKREKKRYYSCHPSVYCLLGFFFLYIIEKFIFLKMWKWIFGFLNVSVTCLTSQIAFFLWKGLESTKKATIWKELFVFISRIKDIWPAHNYCWSEVFHSLITSDVKWTVRNRLMSQTWTIWPSLSVAVYLIWLVLLLPHLLGIQEFPNSTY